MPAEEPAPAGTPQASVAPRAHGWREEVLGAELALGAAGLWLMVSPLLLEYRGEPVALNPIVCGLLLAILALVRLSGGWTLRILSFASVAVGAWLVGSAIVLDGPLAGRWNQGLVGGMAIVLALIGLAGTQRGRELHEAEI